MPTASQIAFISPEDYLAGEETADTKSEYIDGGIYAMSGASANHNRIAGNIHTAFNVHLKGKPCQPYSADMKVNIGSQYFYPDVMVDCSDLPGDCQVTQTPVIVVEVMSKSTRRMDETVKRLAYMQIPAVQEYLLIEQDFVDIEIVRRSNGWLPEHYYLGDEFTLNSIGLTLRVEDVYDRVQNSDMAEWVGKRAEAV